MASLEIGLHAVEHLLLVDLGHEGGHVGFPRTEAASGRLLA